LHQVPRSPAGPRGRHRLSARGPDQVLAPGLLALLLLGGVPHGTTSSGKAAPSSRSASTGSAPSPVRPSGGLTLLLELGGHPAGTVTLSLHGRDYRYVSRHLFAV